MRCRPLTQVLDCPPSRAAETIRLASDMLKFSRRPKAGRILPLARPVILTVSLLVELACLPSAEQTMHQQRQTIQSSPDAVIGYQKHVTNHLILNLPEKAHLAIERSTDYTQTAQPPLPSSRCPNRNSLKFIQATQGESRAERENQLQDSSQLNLQQPLTRLNGLNLTPDRTQTARQQGQVIGLTEAGGSESTKTDLEVFKRASKQAQARKTPAGAKKKLVRLETTAMRTHLDSAGHVHGRRRIPRQVRTKPADEVLQVDVLLGQRLVIPCNHTAAPVAAGQTRQRPKHGRGQLRPNGQGISLLTWHKDSQLDMPIFVADARGTSSLREAKQQTNAEWLRGRAHLEESTHLDARGLGATPALVIEEATSSDSGIYTCTVDFHKAQTQTHQVNVSLIDPPSDMIIRDELAKTRIEANLVGPFDEDTQLSLSCELGSSGQPSAQVTWWRFESVASLADTRWPAAPAEQAQLVASDQQANYLGTLVRHNDQPWRDYFVAFLPSSTVSLRKESAGVQGGRQLQQLALPFDDGRQLRLWSKVKSFGPALELGEPAPGSDQSHSTSSKLRLTLSRANLGDQYLCLAQNTNFMAPLNSSIQINMNLRPLEVKIVNKSTLTFRLDQKVTIECQVHGSKPSAQVRWLKADSSAGQESELKPDGQLVSETNRDIDNDLTKVSYLTIVPQLSDNQRTLTCIGSNPRIEQLNPLSDSITMNVMFAAQLQLAFGSSIRLDAMNVGGDVFMDCSVHANPPIHDLSWLFNDKPLTHNANKGIIMSNHSLVIHGIKIEHRGHYQCVGQNAIGTSVSNKLQLWPRFAPVCDTRKTKTRYEVPVGQQVRIDCFVMAEPSDDLQFSWQLNKTLGDQPREAQHLEELREGFTTNFTQSSLDFKLRSRRHQAQLLCSASNTLGQQGQPCTILVVASEVPDPVISCFFDDFTSTSFSVHCQAPSSIGAGGQAPGQQRQTYLLELQQADGELAAQTASNSSPKLEQQLKGLPAPSLEEGSDAKGSAGLEEQQQQQVQENPLQVRRLTSDTPSFHVTDLKPNTNYLVRAYAQNSRGRSNPLSYERSTLAGSDEQPDSEDTHDVGSAATSMQFHGSGQVQLINKLRPGENSGLAGRLISFLNVGKYIGSSELNSAKPVVGISLIVLLLTISLVSVVFFTSRLCKSAGQTRRLSTDSDRKQKRTARLKQVQHAESGASLRTYDRRDPQLLRLTPACPTSGHISKQQQQPPPQQQQRANAGLGSGSDTSRETNTDSTLVLSSRADLNSSVSPPLLAGAALAPSSSSSTNNNCSSGSLVAPPVHKRTISMVRFSGSPSGPDQADAQPVYCLGERASLIGSSPLESTNHEDTPQVSIRSGSDCTTSHNDSDTFRPGLISRAKGNLGEPIYMIGSSNKCATAGEQTLHILDAATLSRATGYGAVVGCQQEAQASHLNLLSASTSIPVALSGHQDQSQLARNLSQELLCNADDLCLQAAPYLTLGLDGHLSQRPDPFYRAGSSSCCAHTACDVSPANLHWQLGIPAPFSAHLASSCTPDAHSFGSWSTGVRRQSARARFGRNSADLAPAGCCNNDPNHNDQRQQCANVKTQHAPGPATPGRSLEPQEINHKSSFS